MDNDTRLKQLATQIKQWGLELGFASVGISDGDIPEAKAHLKTWLKKNFHGDMDYMARYGTKRGDPDFLLPKAQRVISVTMNYLPPDTKMLENLQDKQQAYVSRYAMGRDYHKLMRKRLQTLADRIQEAIGPFGYRAVCDSAPLMEKPIALKAGLGWMGKHTNVLNRENGSWFFLGSLIVDVPLPVDAPQKEHCGRCRACIDICPTKAIVAPYQLDARRCISYLTIEYKGVIPEEFRKPIGNRIYGCDDCQIVCPWNRFAKYTKENDFLPRHKLDNSTLVELFSWSEQVFLSNTEGSAIRRIGYLMWLRNIAIALGNAPKTDAVARALQSQSHHSSPIIREHVQWALHQEETHSTALA